MAATEDSVLTALRTIEDPDLHRDIVSLGFVKNLAIDGGRVSFTIELTTPACPVKDRLRDQALSAVGALDGVEHVDVEMTASVRSVGATGPMALEGIRNVVAVGAGKGGVGKTTAAVNLAVALAESGSRVGLIDGDIYGPNVPLMLGIQARLGTDGKKIVPVEKYGLRIVSVGFLTPDDSPVIWRGPMLHSIIQQFFRDVRWGELDYLVVDLPPGTGDVALSLSQTVAVSGAVLVTTPQNVSLADTRRAVAMYRKLNVPPVGVVENMSHFVCPSCGTESDIFGKGAAERFAEQMDLRFLGRVPLYQPVRVAGDRGVPIVVAEPDSPAARAFRSVAEQTAAQISIASYQPRTIPLTPA